MLQINNFFSQNLAEIIPNMVSDWRKSVKPKNRYSPTIPKNQQLIHWQCHHEHQLLPISLIHLQGKPNEKQNQSNRVLLAKFLFQLNFCLFSRSFIFDSKIFEQILTVCQIWNEHLVESLSGVCAQVFIDIYVFLSLCNFFIIFLLSFNFHSLSGVYAKFSLNLGHLCQQNKLNCGHLWHKSTKLRWAKELFTTTLLWAFLQTHGS